MDGAAIGRAQHFIGNRWVAAAGAWPDELPATMFFSIRTTFSPLPRNSAAAPRAQRPDTVRCQAPA